MRFPDLQRCVQEDEVLLDKIRGISFTKNIATELNKKILMFVAMVSLLVGGTCSSEGSRHQGHSMSRCA